MPTPTTRDYKGSRSPEAMKKSGRNPDTNNLPDSVVHAVSDPSNYRLNPLFVTEMMGFPKTWLD